MAPDFQDPAVARVFDGFPLPHRTALLKLRAAIFDIAAKTQGVGPLLETLKWGQPAYLTPETKSGSTLRLGLSKPDGYGVFVICHTSLLNDFQHLYPQEFDYQGTRAIHFAPDQDPAIKHLEILIRNALTYHQDRCKT